MHPLDDETEALTILSATAGLGPVTIKLLMRFFSSAREILKASADSLSDFPGIKSQTKSQWNWWKKDIRWKKNLEASYNQNISVIPYTSSEYPKKLLEIPDHPIVLYIKGKINRSDAQSIAIVGTRNSTLYGKEMAEQISRDIARSGFTVVSGLARGVDAYAHKGALEAGRTLAVIGSGLAHIYPEEHKGLVEKIIENGAVISEYPLFTPPDKKHFPQRNRIVSGLSLGVLLIEAPEKSGAIITMEKGLHQRRKLFALPGRADLENFRGNHKWIKSGLASLTENASDVLNSFDNFLSLNNVQSKPLISNFSHLDKEEIELLKQMPGEELGIEEILKLTKLPIIKLNILLMSLVMKKMIKEYPGKIYKRVISK